MTTLSLPLVLCHCAILLVSLEGIVCPLEHVTILRTHVIRIPDILGHTLKQEGNAPKIVTFYVKGKSADYNIKFKSEKEAELFVRLQGLPPHFRILWARIYWNERPVIIAYDKFDTGDIGFKLLDNGDYTSEYERLNELPYLFMRSEIKREIRTRPPLTLYLRNTKYIEDYVIEFRSAENLGTFLKFFPQRMYNDEKTAGYYVMPFGRVCHYASDYE